MMDLSVIIWANRQSRGTYMAWKLASPQVQLLPNPDQYRSIAFAPKDDGCDSSTTNNIIISLQNKPL